MESIDPFRSSVADHGLAAASQPLGSLAQAARRDELKWGRWVMTVFGVVFLGLFGGALLNPPNPAPAHNAAVNAPVGPRPERGTLATLAIVGGALMGVAFILGAPFLPNHPRAVVYTSGTLSVLTFGFALLNNPGAAKGGTLVVCLVAALLVRMWEVGRAFERHQAKAAVGEALP